jgi:A/G-specific adenine glycosylase
MDLFPTIEELALAPLEKVIKAWEGLGYYSRARRLHEGAQHIVFQKGGKAPVSEEELLEIKGIGPYTLGAILSFAYHQKKPAVDGNVSRVIARFFGIKEEITSSKVIKQIYQFVEDLLPQEEPWVVMEALIELGATVCKKPAKCHLCPLKLSCKAKKEHLVELIPLKKKEKKTTKLIREVYLIEHEGFYLVRKESDKNKIMADLYEFPYEEKAELSDSKTRMFLGEYQLLVDSSEVVRCSHSFTRFQVDLFARKWKALHKFERFGYFWIKKEELLFYPFSSGHRKVLHASFSF